MNQPLSSHWADQTAFRITKQKPQQDHFVVASGITPSGTVHIGNFREEITTDFIARSLRKLGKTVDFIFSWDDFDTFRKIPKNFPKQELLTQYLRHPINRVPDPYEDHESYARHNEAVFEEELARVGINVRIIRQCHNYEKGVYAEQIRYALEKRDEIRNILNQFRTAPLSEDWLPTTMYCEQCDQDQIEWQKYLGNWDYSYHCAACHHEATIDIRKTSNLKLIWRVDWPMRWAYEQVDFEPGGKDHSSEGGSYDTAKIIVEKLWHRAPPIYLQYDFVSTKGLKGKMSSSSGDVITLSDAFKVYSPQIIRWIFAMQRPNHDFSIAFDEDVIKTYEEFDRWEEKAFTVPEKPDKKWQQIRRCYELSLVNESEPWPSHKPYRPKFRELCNRLQICEHDIERVKERFYKNELRSDADVQSFHERATAAKNWLEEFAPESFQYRLNTTPVNIPLSETQKKALKQLAALLTDIDLDSITTKELNQLFYDKIIHPLNLEAKEFFSAVYQKLICRVDGPRLPTFLKEIGKERVIKLLQEL